jgi:hypothetical protein
MQRYDLKYVRLRLYKQCDGKNENSAKKKADK